MQNNWVQILARIIIRVKLGVATSEEREVLWQWLDKCEENRSVYKDITRGKSIARRLNLEDEINETTDFRQVYKEVCIRLRKPRNGKILFLRIAAGVAAACLFGVMFYVYSLGLEKEDHLTNIRHVTTTVTLKREKVMLVLEDGKEIGLERHVVDTLSLVQATLFGKEGRLMYEPKIDTTSQPEVRHKVYTMVGGDYSLVLSDGTRVWLNAVSELEYPVQFVGKERVVRLKGEAYFEVARDTSKPFIVEAGGISTRVLGTAFNVSAYDDEEAISTTLLSGKVEVCLKEYDNARPVILDPGMQSMWHKENEEFQLKKVDTEDVVAWRYGVFVFNEDDIEVVTRMLSRWFEVKFVFDGGRSRHHTFSGKMSKDESLEAILNILTLAGGPEFRLEGGTVRVIDK